MNPRLLLSAILLVASACGPSSRPGPDGEPGPEKEAKEDPAAVAALEKMGVLLTRDEKLPARPVVKATYHWRGGPIDPKGESGFLDQVPGLVHLRELELGFAPGVPGKLLAGLSSLTHLSSLKLNQCGIDDDALASIAGLNKLETLHIRASRITAGGLASLDRLTNLRRLDLGGCSGLVDASVKHVAGLKNLEVLLIPNCPRVTDAGIIGLANLSRLRELDLEGSSTSDVGLRKLAELKALTKLNLSDTQVSDAGLSALAGLPLEEIRLARTKAVGASLDKFAKLLVVDLRGAPVKPATFTALAAIPYLRIVDLGGTEAGDMGLEKLKGKETIRELDLSSTKVTSGGLVHLEEMPRLERVVLSVDPAGDEKTAIIPSAVDRLKEARPRLKIVD